MCKLQAWAMFAALGIAFGDSIALDSSDAYLLADCKAYAEQGGIPADEYQDYMRMCLYGYGVEYEIPGGAEADRTPDQTEREPVDTEEVPRV